MTLEERVWALNKCREGTSFTAVSLLLHVKESTVCSIKKEELMHAAVYAASIPHSAEREVTILPCPPLPDVPPQITQP